MPVRPYDEVGRLHREDAGQLSGRHAGLSVSG